MLTIEFMPHSSLGGMASAEKISKLLEIVKEGRIIVMEGRLTKEEEAGLISATMEKIDGNFKGIEVSVTDPENKSETLGQKLRSRLASALLGERQGLTVIGPSTLVREIKKDPGRIMLLTAEAERREG